MAVPSTFFRYALFIEIFLVCALVCASAVWLAARETTQLATIGGFVLLFGVSALAAALVHARIDSRLRRIYDATAALADGSFDHRIGGSGSRGFPRLAASVDRMAERLRLLEQSRQRLLATVSHELRTPLTVIRGEAFTLSRAEHDDRRRARFGLIDSEAERLAQLIDDLLSAATLRATRVVLHKEHEHPLSLMDDAVERFSTEAERRKVELATHVAPGVPAVSVDRSRFEQIIGNLVSNALSHAPPESQIKIAVTRRASTVRFSIENAGAEIAPHHIKSIFEPFMQGASPTGTVGLGLAIARDLVRAHGGDLAVRSREGSTMFWFDIPAGRFSRSAAHQLNPGFAT